MCIANSARSQLAEAIARSLAPEGVAISSAGSHPSRVHPLALRALAELEIDTTALFSKGIDEIDLESVDVVITLCAEQVCPALPRPTARVHWPLADPIGLAPSEEAPLEGFRRLRDELRRRLEIAFAAPRVRGTTP